MNVVVAGCGRMGQGIAITYGLAGHKIQLVDMKDRNEKKFNKLIDDTIDKLNNTLNILYKIKLIKKLHIKKIIKNISILHFSESDKTLNNADIIFECVPEKINIKKDTLKILSKLSSKNSIIASTTSTILSNDLSIFVKFPERFLNAHWLNPPYLMPLIEVSPCNKTNEINIKKIFKSFISIGKVPIRCEASPGYIVPRIQTLAMNEAARIYEEDIATSDDIDKSIIYGFGLRFAVLGLLEFIDWGGIDTLYNASNYMTKSMKSKRFETPKIVKNHIKKNNLGMSTMSGFMNWESINIENYQEEKLKKFVKVIKLLNIKPKINIK